MSVWLPMSAYKLSCFLSRLNRQKKQISTIADKTMRPSPNLWFGNESYATAFQIFDLGNATADWQGSAEGTSASFFHPFGEYQKGVADMVRYKFCVQERSARLWVINFVFGILNGTMPSSYRSTKFFSYGLGNIGICKLIASGQWQPTTQCSYAVMCYSKIKQKFRTLHFVGLLLPTTQDEIKDFCASVKL